MNSFTEENYLKAIYHLSFTDKNISTNRIAAASNTKAASVTDMLKKLADKKLINYIPYQGVSLTEKGEKTALNIIRKHRLWECFLVEKLQFKWDEVHDLAEELEHIQSDELIERLDKFLNYPAHDPHGDPIPDRSGFLKPTASQTIADLNIHEEGTICAVKDHNSTFLQYLEKTNLLIGMKIRVLEFMSYDQSVVLELETGPNINISKEVAKNLLVSR